MANRDQKSVAGISEGTVKSLRNLEAHKYKPGQSGNLGGRPKTHPAREALPGAPSNPRLEALEKDHRQGDLRS
jgi:hypothetical protein